MANDALDGVTPEERARIEALLARPAEGEDGDAAEVAPAGPVRRALRLLLWLACFAAAAAIAWHAWALARLPDRPYDAVHAPIALTIAAGLTGAILLLWFDWRARRFLLLLLAVAALGVCALSMRWIDSSAQGVREYWAGFERQRVRLSGDLCYRIDAERFALRGPNPAKRFVYARHIWPGAYDEAQLRRYFFSDSRMATGADGWTCVTHG